MLITCNRNHQIIMKISTESVVQRSKQCYLRVINNTETCHIEITKMKLNKVSMKFPTLCRMQLKIKIQNKKKNTKRMKMKHLSYKYWTKLNKK